MTPTASGLEACFSPDYAEARTKFIADVRAHGLEVETAVLPNHRGAAGEDLAIDSVLLGNPDARQLLMISSGIHGVEGFCGSGCQVAILRDRELMARIATGHHAVLVVHSLNPYGFSHLRRVNEDNIDLNRNFVDFSSEPPRNTAYDDIAGPLVPSSWDEATQGETMTRLLACPASASLWPYFTANGDGGSPGFGRIMFSRQFHPKPMWQLVHRGSLERMLMQKLLTMFCLPSRPFRGNL